MKLFGVSVGDKARAKPVQRVKRAARRAAPVAPAILLATGAGVALWYWTQWARGRAEDEAAEAAAAEARAAKTRDPSVS